MEKNDIIELKIEDMSEDGSGIGKHEGMAFFVKDAVIGDTVAAKVMKIKKSYGFARLMEIKEASPDRVEPRCCFARSCGGCQLQQMSYASQLLFKQRKAVNNLTRLGGFERAFVERVMEPIVGMEEPYGYRNKAQFPVGMNAKGELVTGFYAGRTHTIIPNTDCALGVPVNRTVLEKTLMYMREYGVPAYNEKTGKGLVRHIVIRYGFDSGEVMACLVVNGRKLPKEDALLGYLSGIRGMASISLNVNQKDTNVILGDETRLLWGEPVIADALYLRDVSNFQRLGEKTSYQISPRSFYQVNPMQTEKLYSLALDYAGLTGNEIVWDLYCGIGTISLFLARRAKWVYGVEAVPQAIEDAKRNAALNGIENVSFFTGKAEDVLTELYGEAEDGEKMLLDGGLQMGGRLQRPDVIVVDPPRKGCDKKCLETMLGARPERIVYVSCDSATLARDLKALCEGGYEVKRARCVDQFGQTTHTECVVWIQRKHI